MFKIEDNTIHLTRGDQVTIEFTIEEYTFQVGDTVEFRIYNKKALDKTPILTKEITVDTETTSVDIILTSQDTKLGSMLNKPIEYWYEVELNDKQTVIGYDEDGAKLFILYPEGVEIQ